MCAKSQRCDARERVRRSLAEALAVVYPREVFNDPNTWSQARRLDAVALALVGGDSEPPDGAERSASYLLDRLAAYRQVALAAYASARPLYERALAIREKALGPDHPDTATSLNDLAVLVLAQGDLAAAQLLYERALAIYEKRLGRNHPVIAVSLDNLAGLLQAQGKLASARPLVKRALAIRENALGPNHPDTASSLNNLANLLRAQGDLAAARPLYKRALAIREQELGPDHPDTATCLNILALVLQAQGELAAARPVSERALAIREKAPSGHEKSVCSQLRNSGRSSNSRKTARRREMLGRGALGATGGRADL